MPRPYILFCAGEDSGDILGEDFVSATVAAGLDAYGAGGMRMEAAGLKPLVNFESLPVSGFLDVLPKYGELRRSFLVLRKALCSEDCLGLIAIDYPGFNMKLCALAQKLGKKILYVAPPQVWAWKRSRAKKLQNVNLAVLFEFERSTYEKFGCHAHLLRHPFLTTETHLATETDLSPRESNPKKVLLLPGSRKRQALRNLKFYLEALCDEPVDIEIIAARKSLVACLEQALQKFRENIPSARHLNISVSSASTDAENRRKKYAEAALAIAPPGTSTLELALSATPLIAAMKVDALTYALGKILVRIPYFAMPNILLDRGAVPEILCPPWKKSPLGDTLKKYQDLRNSKNAAEQLAFQLKEKMSGGLSAKEILAMEFLG